MSHSLSCLSPKPTVQFVSCHCGRPNASPCSRSPALHPGSSLSRERTWRTFLVYTMAPIGKIRCSPVGILKFYLEQWRFFKGGPRRSTSPEFAAHAAEQAARAPLLLLSTALLGLGKGFSTNKQRNSLKVLVPQFTCY